MICPNCGQESPEGFRFCPACAAPLVHTGAPADEADARLRAGQVLLAEGRRAEADEQFERALGIYRAPRSDSLRQSMRAARRRHGVDRQMLVRLGL